MSNFDHRQTPLAALAGHGFSRIADASQSEGNEIKLLRDGPENFPAWLDAIGKAGRTIHLENYILEEDRLGGAFADALVEAARRGVRCRVLHDWFGCRARTSAVFWTRLRQAGIEVRSYNPPSAIQPLGWISRDHRKVLCVDGVQGFTGGLCIGHDWVGDEAKGIPPWRDTGVAIRGPAVADMERAFADSWRTAGPPIPEAELREQPTPASVGDLKAWVIAGRPDSMGLYRLEQLVAEIAERSLWLTDAYFVATTGYVHALAGAARDGVDVRLLVPGSSNFPAVRALSRAGYRPLLEAGVRVFEWNGPMLHAKTAVSDGCWSRVGSSNSNLASWISNRELDVTIQDEGFAEQMQAMYERDLENATEIVLESGKVRSSSPGPDDGAPQEGRKAKAGRLLAGTVGAGSAVGASLTQHRVLGAAEVGVLLAGGIALALLCILALILPPLIAYPLGAAAAWVAVVLLLRAWKIKYRGTLHDRDSSSQI